MPILDPDISPIVVYPPESNAPIAKYLDLTKFLSLLQKNSLFFCRLSKLEDHFEGKTTKANLLEIENRFRNQHLYSKKLQKLTEAEVQEELDKFVKSTESFKNVACVSCWNLFETESAALWKIYSDFHKGILITSTVEKLKAAFANTPEQLTLSKIKYIDYKKDRLPDNNRDWPLYHKHLAYSYEEEVRIAHLVKYKSGFSYDWTSEEVSTGKYIRLEIDNLIDKIIVSPYSPEWYLEMLQDVISKYGLNKKAERSQLSSE